MRESFLRELMLLQSSPILSADFSSSSSSPTTTTTTTKQQRRSSPLSSTTTEALSSTVQSTSFEQTSDNNNKKIGRPVNVTFLSDTGLAGRTLSGLFVACDTNLTHIILNDLKTPIGLQSSALLRLNDVIAITYC